MLADLANESLEEQRPDTAACYCSVTYEAPASAELCAACRLSIVYAFFKTCPA
eukprot:SAG31_NODE_1131_length_9748_cov_3.466473_7_plen_53_part_00